MSSDARSSFWIARVLVSALLFGASVGALAQHCAAPAARVVSIQGSIELRLKNAQQWQAAHSGAQLCSGDSVRTGLRSRAALLLPNETTLRLDQGTTLTLSAPDPAQASLLDLILGTIHVISRTPRPFRVNTPYLNAGVEGTEFLVGSNEAGARLAVFEGKVSATSAEGSLMLVGGEIAYAAKGAPLRKERMLRPADAVQWALYYPTVFDYRLGEGIAGTPGEAALRESMDLYRQDRLAEAIFRLDKASAGQSNPRFLTYRAGLLLLVGQADEASSNIEQALAVDAGNSNAHALKSVVALTRNDKDQALKLATRAVELDPASPVGRIALSYAQQAHFKIEEALASVQKAVELDSQNALAWARLAELHMSTGYLDRALEAAKRAVSLNPEVAKTQSVLGFANLTRIDTQAAKQAFEKAIDLDQADPLPRLGLGLAMIREGELTAGREQLEIAVCLDPENSLLRSYVGKAYYEEKRDRLAGIQFDLAKERDPNDPTPWFYDALARQSENAPIQAFTALQGALDRNDARAVTRSRLLLDQDKATISASLAGVYNSLGFEQLARSVVYGELENDPTNAALHNFLAESYLGLPLLDVARASEALQAKLNQPVGTLFSEPLLAESRLFLLKPVRLSSFFRSDAARLLDRSGFGLVAEGLFGNNDTAGSGLFVRGTNGRLAASATQAYFRSDGLRPEEPFKTDVSSAFLQFALANGSDVQVEATRSYFDRGELIAAFDPDSRLGLSDQERFERYRFGLKHSFGAQTDVLLSAIKQKGNFKQGGLGLTFEDTDSNTTTVETQVALATDRSRFVVGAGNLTGRTKSKATDLAPEPFDSKRSQNNVYLYAYSKWLEGKLNSSLGLSWDRSKLNERDVNTVNPKFGLILRPLSNVTLRLGAVKSLQREFVASQTIEPTQVVGINQFLFGVEQTRWWHYGGGVDVRLRSDLFAGFDVAKRYGTYPIGFSWRDFQLADWRAYANGIVSPRVAVAADYFFAEYREPADGDAILGRTLLRTHRVPLTLSWQALSRTVIQVRATSVRQTGLLQAVGGPQFSPTQSFWITDLDVEYRFPMRYGSLRLAIRNLLDRRFQFEEPDVRNPILAPSRLILLSVKLQFQ